MISTPALHWAQCGETARDMGGETGSCRASKGLALEGVRHPKAQPGHEQQMGPLASCRARTLSVTQRGALRPGRGARSSLAGWAARTVQAQL